MSAEQILIAIVFSVAVVVCAVQYGIAIGQQRREERIERQRGAEIKVLLEWVSTVWRTR